MQISDDEESETILNEIRRGIPSPGVISRRSAGISVGTALLVAGIWYGTVDPREDPWTGQEAAREHRRIDADVSRQEAELHQLRESMGEAEKDLWTLTIRFAGLHERYQRLEESVHGHHTEAERLEAILSRNTSIVLQNQMKAHRHNKKGKE